MQSIKVKRKKSHKIKMNQKFKLKKKKIPSVYPDEFARKIWSILTQNHFLQRNIDSPLYGNIF